MYLFSFLVLSFAALKGHCSEEDKIYKKKTRPSLPAICIPFSHWLFLSVTATLIRQTKWQLAPRDSHQITGNVVSPSVPVCLHSSNTFMQVSPIPLRTKQHHYSLPYTCTKHQSADRAGDTVLSRNTSEQILGLETVHSTVTPRNRLGWKAV